MGSSIWKYVWIILFGLIFYANAFAQPGQIAVNRVQLMPNFPAPYLMRDWKSVAMNYDQFIFSATSTGQHLPLLSIKPVGVNYPELSPILLQTYVGTFSANQAEAINIIPAIVGASLVGINKSNHSGINWTEKTKDFFNKNNGQDVYLNGYSTTSGGDWWYDVMPNIFFYQLYAHYPDTESFDQQFTSVADQWLEAVYAMGGSTTPWSSAQMEYRAWNLITMTGNSNGVKEPEAAGGIGWLLYSAYQKTGEKKYLEGAQMSIEFLSNLTSNPSYELQLPYGAFIAAKMNAELGTTYDVAKIINWCFDRGPLRGWGVITGTWNGADVDGLIGEANDSGNDYAFSMNGFQQAAALVPLIKYDKRFARVIAKWTLNVANASRLFYPQYLPASSQDDFTWSNTHDPQSVIAYEALKEVWEGKPLYGTGDAKRSEWAETNLGIYGSSHVGYLAAVVEPTDVEGILALDVNKTDFFSDTTYPSYVLYNPYPTDQVVTLTLPPGSYDIYNAISETTVATNVNGSFPITIKSDEAVLLVYLPSGSIPIEKEGKFYADDEVIDYHYGYDFTGSLRIKSLAVMDTLVAFNQQVPVYTTVDNATTAVTYTWRLDGVVINTGTENEFTWSVPETEGRVVLKLDIESDGRLDQDSIVFNVVDRIPAPPVIQMLSADEAWYQIGGVATVTCEATDEGQSPESLLYNWSVSGGTISNATGSVMSWQLPATAGVYEVTCEVVDADLQATTEKRMVLVKQNLVATTPPVAYYPLDGDVKDYSGNEYHAQKAGVNLVPDFRGEPDHAYQFDSGSDIIFIENESSLNFQDQLTLSFWIKLNSLSEESFILSHGSWEERWKVSVIPNGHIRWTVKTNLGTKDLDTSFPIALGQFYHVTAVYSGYSMELYVDGELDSFIAAEGLMSTTTKSITFGRKEEGVSLYYLRGTLDEVRMYNTALEPDEINTLKSIWNVVTGIESLKTLVDIYPNPTTGMVTIRSDNAQQQLLNVYNAIGKKISVDVVQHTNDNQLYSLNFSNYSDGIYYLQLRSLDKISIHKIVLLK